ncbi:protein SFI1 homolog isoform X2 [Lampris incognitus]|uniref:protein SFI1 homolog isoform X2 n=1 Tax=Lampris incognitus TaxID=2546036 RepID=UPI0024B53E86|nr:protein SFI1 homolog isoform X2 [Lampris incognitus]
MQTNRGRRDPLKPSNAGRANSKELIGGGEIKQTRKVVLRRPPYRVGYSWNKGGKPKELRIRCHHGRVVLLRAFAGWRDEWWTTRREWTPTVQAKCHYRYNLCNRTFHTWKMDVCFQKEKRRKAQYAQCYADVQKVLLVWDHWEVFLEMRRMKGRILKSALQQKRITALRLVWNLWQTKLRQRFDMYALEDQALQQWALTLQRRAWLQLKELHIVACCQREKEVKVTLHFIRGQQRKAWCRRKSYVRLRQAKKKLRAAAMHVWNLRLVSTCLSNWCRELNSKQREENQWQAPEHLAKRNIQCRTVDNWKTYLNLRRQSDERHQMAIQHRCCRLLHVGSRGLSLNATWSKVHRMNKNVAVQHYCQTTTKKYCNLWWDHLEEVEDKSRHPQMTIALSHYSPSLLSSLFHHWKVKHAEQRYMKGLLHHADVWFAEHILPKYLTSWVEFTLQRRLQRERREKAELYNRQRQYIWVFYTWRGHSEKRKERRLMSRMAILHEERQCLRRTWTLWRQRTQQQIDERQKQSASDNLYVHQLLHRTLKRWKENVTEIQDRRNREEQVCRHRDLRCMKWAMDSWQKLVQSQREENSRVDEMHHHHEVKLLKCTLQAWKDLHLQTAQIYGQAEERYRLKRQQFLRMTLGVWIENAMHLKEAEVREQIARSHFQRCAQFEVFLAWRRAASNAVSKRHQQGEALTGAQSHLNQGRLHGTSRRWREETREAVKERMSMEKARQHHRSKILPRVLNAWKQHHQKYQKYELQHRREEAEQTERALWHWSLGLQAKVLYAWRTWVTERLRKQDRLTRAARFYRDQLLREGVTHILTYTAHMSSLTASLAQCNQEQRSRRLQRVVQRCAMRWKQQALCKTDKEQDVRGLPPKKSVTFCLPAPGSRNMMSHRVTHPDSVDQEPEDQVLSQLVLSRASRLQPRLSKELFDSPVKELYQTSNQSQSADKKAPGGHQQLCLQSTSQSPGRNHPPDKRLTPMRSCLQPFSAPITSRPLAVTKSPIISPVARFESQLPYGGSPHGLQYQDVLLPPSSFMTVNTQTKSGTTYCPKDAALLAPDQFILPPNPHSSTYSGVYLKASSKEVEAHTEEEEYGDEQADPTLPLTRELLSIRQDMERFQQDRKQLQAWQRLKEVLKGWLQSSEEEEQMEKKTVCQELKELEERIRRLSADLAKRKPEMLLHTERVQRLNALLRKSTGDVLSGRTGDGAADRSQLTT